jgi:hypothetical protein
MPGGYFGQALVVDATDGASQALDIPEGILRAYLGGAGLGTWLLHRLGTPRPGTEPGPVGDRAADQRDGDDGEGELERREHEIMLASPCCACVSLPLVRRRPVRRRLPRRP